MHGGVERAAGFLDDGGALQLDRRRLDVGLDASEYAREQVASEQLELAGHRRAGVVALA
jgi:hypothetical protein